MARGEANRDGPSSRSHRRRGYPIKVLVTGGTGFTGSHLTRRLLREGHDVVVLDERPGLFDEDLAAAGARIELGSVTDASTVRRLTGGVELVYHLAAAFRRVTLPEETYWKVNVEGTRHVLESAAEHGARRVVYCSTQGVHGHVDDPPGDEHTAIEPEDYYQYTKWEGERVCHEYMRDGLEISIVRPTAIYGPGDPGRFLHLFKLAKRGWFPMFGDGETTYHPVHIDNLVDLFLLAGSRPEAVGETYLGGDARYWTLNELVKAVGHAMDRDVRIVHLPFRPLWLAAIVTEAACKPLRISPPLFRRRVDWFRQVRAFRIDKARDELGYEPRIGLEEGLRATADWYFREGYL